MKEDVASPLWSAGKVEPWAQQCPLLPGQLWSLQFPVPSGIGVWEDASAHRQCDETPKTGVLKGEVMGERGGGGGSVMWDLL